MYIGVTVLDDICYLIWEVFDNSRDEAMNKVHKALESNYEIR